MTIHQAISPRFKRSVFLWAVVAALTELVVAWLIKHSQAPRWLGLTPLLPFMVFFGVMVQSILKMDEMQKRIRLESASTAFLLSLIVSCIFGGIEMAGIGRAPWDFLEGLMLLFWAGAYALFARRYR